MSRNDLIFKETQHFKLFANCIPVKGASRSLICDLQRNRFDFISNELYDFLEAYNGAKIAEIRKDFDKKSQPVIDEFLFFLHQKNHIFFCDPEEVKWFPELENRWESPCIIENAIVDVDTQSKHDFSKIFSELEQLGCKAVELRFFSSPLFEDLEKWIQLLHTSSITSVQLILPYSEAVPIAKVDAFLKEHARVFFILFHSCPSGESPSLDQLESHLRKKVEFTTQRIDSSAHCGFISPYYFRVDISSFTESLSFNNCLNKKISVDCDGEIRNCPALPDSYGNMATTTLAEALRMEGFKKYWNITKDQIAVCKNCEFRYLCSDCRAFTQDPESRIAKPAKCSYDPVSTSWGVQPGI